MRDANNLVNPKMMLQKLDVVQVVAPLPRSAHHEKVMHKMAMQAIGSLA